MKPSRIIQWVLGAGLAAAGLLIFFQNVNMHGLVRQILQSNPLVLAACAALAVGSIWFRSLRWHILLPASPDSHKKQLFSLVVIGFMINNILPARLGEAARAVLLWKRNGYGLAVSIGSLILERGIDILVFSTCLFMPVFLVPLLSPGSGLAAASSVYKTVTLQTIAIALAAGVCFSIVLFFAYARFPLAVRRMGNVCCSVLPQKIRPKLRRIASEIMSNLDWVFSVKKVAMVTVLSFCIVACYGLMVVLLIADQSFGLLEGLFSEAFAAIGAAIPLAPGYVGTLHAVLLQGLILCGCEREKAQAVTILFHAVPYIAVTLLGLYYFFSMNISFKDISEAEKTIEKEEKK